MPYRSFREDRVLAIRWLGAPTRDDSDRVAREISAARGAAGHPIHCVGIFSCEEPVPASDVRDHMVRQWPELMTHCDAMYLLLVGPGVRASLVRSVFRGMMVVSRVRGVSIHERLDEVMAGLRRVLPSEAS